jgi:hypothetical protein
MPYFKITSGSALLNSGDKIVKAGCDLSQDGKDIPPYDQRIHATAKPADEHTTTGYCWIYFAGCSVWRWHERKYRLVVGGNISLHQRILLKSASQTDEEIDCQAPFSEWGMSHVGKPVSVINSLYNVYEPLEISGSKPNRLPGNPIYAEPLPIP